MHHFHRPKTENQTIISQKKGGTSFDDIKNRGPTNSTPPP